MTALRDLTVGHLIVGFLKVLACGFVAISMWMGQVTLLVVIGHLLHLHYNVFGIPAIDHAAENILVCMPPLIPAGIVTAVCWQHFLIED